VVDSTDAGEAEQAIEAVLGEDLNAALGEM